MLQVSILFDKLFIIICVKINNNLKRGGLVMKGKFSKSVAKKMVSVLNLALRADANSASCVLTYQPEAPKELAKFRRTK